MLKLRHYQSRVETEIYEAWAAGHQNVLAVMPTGSGKTPLSVKMLRDHQGAAVAIAHREELLAQLSLTLNRFGVRHRIVAPPATVKTIVRHHLKTHGRSHYDPNGSIGVAGADTVAAWDRSKHAAMHAKWRLQVTFFLCDEAAHFVDNKWMRAYEKFSNVTRCLGVTAWPGRGDGKGLGRHADGIFDHMVLGPTLDDLIDDGYLSPYQIWTVPYSADYDHVPVGASGELVQAKLVAAEEGTNLVGDIVKTYQQRVPGKRAICFLSSIKRAQEVAAEFCAAGVPALALDGTTDKDTRALAAGRLASGEILVLCNADLYGEGNDIPAVEVVIMGTRTASYQRYLQWFGRMLRLASMCDGYDEMTPEQRRAYIAASAKPYGILIDHAGNVVYHNGPPGGRQRIPTLDRAERRSSGPSDAIPYRVCVNPGYRLAIEDGPTWREFYAAGWTLDQMVGEGVAAMGALPCAQPYAATERACPHCGFVPEPVSRKSPEHVDGDLELLDAETIAALQGAIPRSVGEYRDEMMGKVGRMNGVTFQGLINRHAERLEQLDSLRDAMAWWLGLWKSRGDNKSQAQRRFFHTFGLDVLSARALKRAEAEKLERQIRDKLTLDGVVIAQ